MNSISLLLAVVCVAAARADTLQSPLAAALEHADEVQKDVVTAFPSYDVDRIDRAVKALEQRATATAKKDDDDYFIAQGKLELLLIRRFYETDLEKEMPAALASIDHDALADDALAAATRFADAHADHSDVHRVIGELFSTKIRGMASGMKNGPKAKEAIDRALELDPKNSLAVLCQGRMHFHNPSFAGGDKDKALEEFRRVAQDTDDLRAHLYLARIYRDREMYPQARFWVKKAERVAKDNPEARFLESDLAAREKQEKS